MMNELFPEGNQMIEKAIADYYAETDKVNLVFVLAAIRRRMHADGQFLFPIVTNPENENEAVLHVLTSGDGKHWYAAFTSQEEFEKGEPCDAAANFIDWGLKLTLESDTDGIIINPWGQSFMLTKELIKKMFSADGDRDYAVSDEPITAELLEDGSFLKKAIEVCNRNRTQRNLIKLSKILRDSWVWVPCTAVLSDADQEAFNRRILEAADNDGLDALVGTELVAHDSIRFVPDILQSGEDFFFPVFTSEEEMGEYGEDFSRIQKHFLEAANLAKNNERNVKGIVINPFTEAFVIPAEMFEIIARMESSVRDIGGTGER